MSQEQGEAHLHRRDEVGPHSAQDQVLSDSKAWSWVNDALVE